MHVKTVCVLCVLACAVCRLGCAQQSLREGKSEPASTGKPGWQSRRRHSCCAKLLCSAQHAARQAGGQGTPPAIPAPNQAYIHTITHTQTYTHTHTPHTRTSDQARCQVAHIHLSLRLGGSGHSRRRLLLQHQLPRTQLLLLHLTLDCGEEGGREGE